MWLICLTLVRMLAEQPTSSPKLILLIDNISNIQSVRLMCLAAYISLFHSCISNIFILGRYSKSEYTVLFCDLAMCTYYINLCISYNFNKHLSNSVLKNQLNISQQLVLYFGYVIDTLLIDEYNEIAVFILFVLFVNKFIIYANACLYMLYRLFWLSWFDLRDFSYENMLNEGNRPYFDSYFVICQLDVTVSSQRIIGIFVYWLTAVYSLGTNAQNTGQCTKQTSPCTSTITIKYTTIQAMNTTGWSILIYDAPLVDICQKYQLATNTYINKNTTAQVCNSIIHMLHILISKLLKLTKQCFMHDFIYLCLCDSNNGRYMYVTQSTHVVIKAGISVKWEQYNIYATLFDIAFSTFIVN